MPPEHGEQQAPTECTQQGPAPQSMRREQGPPQHGPGIAFSDKIISSCVVAMDAAVDVVGPVATAAPAAGAIVAADPVAVAPLAIAK
uniref:SFRICE_027074 n=1 Tax=Spodoptera frugiperda TaxID=7108 RepID=A0A2H1V3I4_SPOFR